LVKIVVKKVAIAILYPICFGPGQYYQLGCLYELLATTF